MYRIGQRVIYDSVSECYKSLLTINEKPTRSSKLTAMIRQIRLLPLSPFDRASPCSPKPSCGYVFYNPSTNKALTVAEVTYLVNVIITSGYTIDYKLSKLLGRLPEGEDRFLFYVSEK